MGPRTRAHLCFSREGSKAPNTNTDAESNRRRKTHTYTHIHTQPRAQCEKGNHRSSNLTAVQVDSWQRRWWHHVWADVAAAFQELTVPLLHHFHRSHTIPSLPRFLPLYLPSSHTSHLLICCWLVSFYTPSFVLKKTILLVSFSLLCSLILFSFFFSLPLFFRWFSHSTCVKLPPEAHLTL